MIEAVKPELIKFFFNVVRQGLLTVIGGKSTKKLLTLKNKDYGTI